MPKEKYDFDEETPEETAALDAAAEEAARDAGSGDAAGVPEPLDITALANRAGKRK